MSKFGKILLVDDEKEILFFLSQKLEQEGFSVKTAQTVKETISLLSSQTFDLVICDYRLHDGNGSDILKFIESKVPTIILSGYSDISKSELKKLGGVDLISKPVKFEHLVNKINTYIKTKKESQSA